MSETPLIKLLSYILPPEFNEYFDLTDVKEEDSGIEKKLHLYLHEKDIRPSAAQTFLRTDSILNPASTIFLLTSIVQFCMCAAVAGRTRRAGHTAGTGN